MTLEHPNIETQGDNDCEHGNVDGLCDICENQILEWIERERQEQQERRRYIERSRE
jgi:hypothetical protein